MWWIVARRRARQNLIVPALAGGLFAVVGFHTLGTPPARAELHLSVVLGAGLLAALLLPVQFRGESVFASARWGLLPFAPRLVWLLRPLLGDPLRLMGTAAVAFWGWVGIVRLELAPLRTVLEALQWSGWVGAGLVGAELLDEVLRRRRSLLLLEAEVIVFVLAASVLVQSAAERAEMWSGVRPQGAWTAPLLGGGAPLRWEMLFTGALLLAVGTLLAAGLRLAERFARTPPPEARRRSWGGAIGALARRATPRAPARLAKEIASVVRIPLLRLNYLLAAGVAAAAFWGGAPFLLPFVWLFWIGFAFNLLGPDLPGGLRRYALLPGGSAGALSRRHLAVLLTTTLCVVAVAPVALLAGRAGIPAAGWASPLAYALWLGFGASVFLLVTIPADHFAARSPRPLRVRQLIDEGSASGGPLEGMLAFLSMVATVGVAVLLLLGWSAGVATALPAVSPSARFALAATGATLTNTLLYAARLRKRTRDG